MGNVALLLLMFVWLWQPHWVLRCIL